MWPGRGVGHLRSGGGAGAVCARRAEAGKEEKYWNFPWQRIDFISLSRDGRGGFLSTRNVKDARKKRRGLRAGSNSVSGPAGWIRRASPRLICARRRPLARLAAAFSLAASSIWMWVVHGGRAAALRQARGTLLCCITPVRLRWWYPALHVHLELVGVDLGLANLARMAASSRASEWRPGPAEGCGFRRGSRWCGAAGASGRSPGPGAPTGPSLAQSAQRR